MPFLKVDQGLADEADGAQVMKPIPDLDALLARAIAHGLFGTKMRSVIKLANPAGVEAVVAPAVRGRPPDPGRRARADHRARGRHPQPREGGRRGPAQGGAAGRARAPRRRPAHHAEAHPARSRRLLHRAGGPPARAARRRPLRRLHAGGGQRPAGPQPRRRRELLPRAHRGPDRPADATPSSTRPSTRRSRASTRPRWPRRAGPGPWVSGSPWVSGRRGCGPAPARRRTPRAGSP